MTPNNEIDKLRHLADELHVLGTAQAPQTLRPAVLQGVGLADGYWQMHTAVGPVFVAYNPQGISAVQQVHDAPAFETLFHARFGRRAYPVAAPPTELVRAIARQLNGARQAQLDFDLRNQSEFEQAVLRQALAIPRGQVRPYAWIAREIGRPKAVRAVGTALGNNPVPLLIPCHRVVRSDGMIGEYIFGSAAKRAVLEAEGIVPAQLAQQARSGTRYVGSDTTHIFCYPTCSSARRITKGHRVPFGSEGAALTAGYRPCKVCRP